ncbi:MAG: hypothetical protein UR27_C0010G0004 [Candidatus Peregrinibacteria bacterium GW2011_GWA2_33_10]|nr:MAG: hypothetical protein UR27_C0010G0004 [Candidatus Peregrinibacteria bacterium GW2011_GWA2_33_10]
MTKRILKILTIFIALNIFLGLSFNAFAQILPIQESNKYTGGGSSVKKGASAVENVKNIGGQIYQDLLYVIGSVAVMFIIYSGFRMVTSNGEDEVLTKQKKNIITSIIGLVLISMAMKIDDIFFFGQDGDYEGTFLTSTEHIIASAGIFNKQVFIIIALLKMIVNFIAIAYLVRLTSIIVNQVFFSIEENYSTYGDLEPTINLPAGVAQIIGVTNFVVTFVGPVAIFGLIVGAAYYIMSLGNDESMGKAKKIITNSIIGLLIIYGAFGFVTTFILGSIGPSWNGVKEKEALGIIIGFIKSLII